MPPDPQKTYLGDGVYVDLEYGRIKLTAEYLGIVDHVIYLEPPVLDALNRWCVRLRRTSDDPDCGIALRGDWRV